VVAADHRVNHPHPRRPQPRPLCLWETQITVAVWILMRVLTIRVHIIVLDLVVTVPMFKMITQRPLHLHRRLWQVLPRHNQIRPLRLILPPVKRQ
jgi:hypothetical protein